MGTQERERRARISVQRMKELYVVVFCTFCRIQLQEMDNAILHFGSKSQKNSTRLSLVKALYAMHGRWRQSGDTSSMMLENSLVRTYRFLIARTLACHLTMSWSRHWSIPKIDIPRKTHLVISTDGRLLKEVPYWWDFPLDV